VEIILSSVEPTTATRRPASADLRVDSIDEPPMRADVDVNVFFRESTLLDQVKAAGGRWPKTDKLWQMPYETAVSLGLEHRIARR